jgi:Glycosyl transferases group 1/Glycosyltransferase Family 4
VPAADVTTSAPRAGWPTRRPRILLVTFGSVLDPRGGLPVRSRLLAEALTELGYRPAIISSKEPRRPPATNLPGWARELHVLEHPLHTGFSFELSRTIRRVARNNDLIIVANAMFFPALALSRSRLPVIWDTNECQTLHYRRLPPRWSTRLRALAWTILESWGTRRSAIAVAIGVEEAAWWRRLYPALDGRLIVVDHMPLAGLPQHDDVRGHVEALCGRSLGGPLLVFAGTLVGKHNAVAARWLLDELAPRLDPNTTLVLCGPGTERLTPVPGTEARVRCLGPVEDLDSVIAAADFCLAPLSSGAGVKTKVLHYLAHGRRVIGTPIAFEGLTSAPGLISASLDDLPGVIHQAIEGHESDFAASRRRTAQADWIEATHGRRHVIEQWRRALQCLNLN